MSLVTGVRHAFTVGSFDVFCAFYLNTAIIARYSTLTYYCRFLINYIERKYKSKIRIIIYMYIHYYFILGCVLTVYRNKSEESRLYKRQGCSLWGTGGSRPPPPKNFSNFVIFLGKIAARRKFCIVDEILAPLPTPARRNSQATALEGEAPAEHSMVLMKETALNV